MGKQWPIYYQLANVSVQDIVLQKSFGFKATKHVSSNANVGLFALYRPASQMLTNTEVFLV